MEAMTTNSTSIHIGPETKTWEDPLAIFAHKDDSTRMERIMEYLSWENYRLHQIIQRFMDERKSE
jgi:hypothetical protein